MGKKLAKVKGADPELKQVRPSSVNNCSHDKAYTEAVLAALREINMKLANIEKELGIDETSGKKTSNCE